MFDTFWPLLAIAPFFLFLVFHGMRRQPCPSCGTPLSGFQSPLTKTRRQWIEGGYLCRRCGCESDLAGAPVPPDAGYRRVALFQAIVLVAAAVLPAIVLGALLLR